MFECLLDNRSLLAFVLPPFLEKSIKFVSHIHLHVDLRVPVKHQLLLQLGKNSLDDLLRQVLHVRPHVNVPLKPNLPVYEVQLVVPRIKGAILTPDWVTFFSYFHTLQYPQVPDLEQHVGVDKKIFPFYLVRFNAADKMNVTLAEFFHEFFHLPAEFGWEKFILLWRLLPLILIDLA